MFPVTNPQFNGVLECLYVGMTSKTPAERFMQHRTGIRQQKRAQAIRQHGTEIRAVSASEHVRTFEHDVHDKDRGVGNERKTCQ